MQRCGTDAPQSSGTPCRAARTRWCSAVGLTHPGHQARPPCRSTLTGEPARPIRGSCGTDPPQSSGTPSVPHPLRCFFFVLAHLGCDYCLWRIWRALLFLRIWGALCIHVQARLPCRTPCGAMGICHLTYFLPTRLTFATRSCVLLQAAQCCCLPPDFLPSSASMCCYLLAVAPLFCH